MQGMFHGDISKQLHIPESSIQTIINKYKLFGYVSTAKNKKNTQTVPLTWNSCTGTLHKVAGIMKEDDYQNLQRHLKSTGWNLDIVECPSTNTH